LTRFLEGTTGRVGRRVFRVLPPTVKNPLRRLLLGEKSSRISRSESEPPFGYSPDVADADDLKARLAQTNIFGSQLAEAHGYLVSALERFRITMSLIPPLDIGGRVLELGANPYFLTRLLRERGLDVTCANWFGEGNPVGSQGFQDVIESGAEHTYKFDHFNLECESFPYDNDSFEMVLFCEILEHLPADPINALAEIHRVLRPGGQLILTTPNAARTENLIRLVAGENVYETLSGYGAYGRHNREYTVEELRQLLVACGYEVPQLFTMDIGGVVEDAAIPENASRANRGFNLFAVAEPIGQPKWVYPDWLFSSRHALWRLVMPSLVVGRNDDLQCRGFHAREVVGGCDARWTGADDTSIVLVGSVEGTSRVVIEGVAPPHMVGSSLRLSADVEGTRAQWDIECNDGAFRVESDHVTTTGRPQEIVIRTDRTWKPNEVGLSTDERTLGVAVTGVSLEPS
jgi:SAM-dependent methyltransferase